MPSEYQNSYRVRHGIHLAVADLVRVGMTGDATAVERLAQRLVEEPPTGIREEVAFRDAVELAIANAKSSERTFARGVADGTSGSTAVSVAPSAPAQRFSFNGVAKSGLHNVLKEDKARAELTAAGLAPTSKLLLSGPPGVGKTASAHWLAGHLSRPLFVLDLAQTVSSRLGESGKNIRLAFAEAQRRPSVFLVDEFDALAKRRDDDGDVGELKRLVNVMLIELDSWTGASLLVAATNHSQLLDPAIQRRFDHVIEVPMPNHDEIAVIVDSSFGGHVGKALIKTTSLFLDGLSNSDVVRFCRSVYRESIVEGVALEQTLLERLVSSPEPNRAKRDELFLQLHQTHGMSTRRIAQHASVSHPTVSAGINRAKELHNVKRLTRT